MNNKSNPYNTYLGWWLLILTLMVYLIILIGGLTRLTESGLSMVDWRPLLGIIPPISEQDWYNVFEEYKKTPEYLIVNKNMEVNQFKYIFWWEYFHRFFARLIGFVFLIPFIYFLFKNYLTKKIILQLIVVFVFGCIQAVVGWWMVKSGLNENPYVSQYRLSFHLLNAIIILSVLLWMTLSQFVESKNNFINFKKLKLLVFASLLLCLLTIISGSFVAGTDAGKSFNTFPLMNGKFIPEGYIIYENFIINFFENTIAIQFNHRWLAVFSFFYIVIIFLIALQKKLTRLENFFCYAVIFFVTFQIIIGILTLINNSPILYASIHQANAILLYCSILTTFFLFSKRNLR